MRNILYLMLLACCLVGCPKNEPAHPSVSADTIVDATGISFKLPVSTGRIISLAPSITENIKTLDAQGSLVGRTDFCKITDVASVGTILEPSIEKIISLKPDLILATKEGNNPKTVERLRGLKAEMFVFGESNSWDDIKSNFRLCGRLLDKSAKAEQILKDIQDELSLINVRVDMSSYATVFVQLNVSPLMTAGPNTFINDIIKYGYGRNIAADSKISWPTLSVEEIIRRNPNVIIISDMGGMTEQAKAMWQEERFAGIPAVKSKRIYVMESELLCQPTPTNFIKAVKQIWKYLYPGY